MLRHGSKQTRLWHAELDPYRNERDAGPHQALVAAVQIMPGDEVDWRIDPGHGGDNTSCDWSYVRDFVFARDGGAKPTGP